MGYVDITRFRHFAKPEPIQPPHPVVKALRDRLERKGFAFEEGGKLLPTVSPALREFVAVAAEAGRDAPLDRNPGGAEEGRYRYYSTAQYTRRAAAGKRLKFDEPYEECGEVFTTYLQPANANANYAEERRFAPWPDDLLAHPGLLQLVELILQATPGSMFEGGKKPDRIKVGLHLISILAEGNYAALNTPNWLHFDGEFLTAIVMLERIGVIGGQSLIAPRRFAGTAPDELPDSARLFEGTLTQPLDILLADDRRVSHYVSPVFARENLIGRRTVILVDFTPLEPRTSDQRLEAEARERKEETRQRLADFAR